MWSLILFILSAFFFGDIVLGLLRIRISGIVRYYILSFGMGTVCWYLALFLLGHAGLLYPWLLAALSIIASCVSCIIIFRHIRKMSIHAGQLRRWIGSLTYVDLLLISAVVIILAFTFASTFAPVTGGVANDSINYHLSTPTPWLRHHKIVELSWPISYLAGYGDLLYTLPLALGSVAGTKLISWFFMCASFALVAELTRRRFGARAGLIAGVVWIANPLVFRTSFTAFIDLQAAFFTLCALWSILSFNKNAQGRMILLGGLFMGVGCGIKPTNYCYAIALTGVMVFLLLRTPGRPVYMRAKQLLLLCLCCVVFALPWPVRNTLLTASPTFPPPLPLYHISDTGTFHFGDVAFSRDDAREWFGKCDRRTRAYGEGISGFILLPWHLTMHPEAFQAGDSVTAMMLSFLPLIFLAGPRPRRVTALLLFSLLGTILVYFLLYPEARFFIPVFLAMSPAIAWGIITLWQFRRRHITFAVTFVMALNILFACAVAARLCLPKIRTVIDREYRYRYMKAHIPYFEAFNYLASHSKRRVVRFYNHQTMFYLTNEYVVDSTAARHPGSYPDAYFLDIDYSQTCRRDTAHATGGYWLSDNPDSLRLVFQGPDARIYRYFQSKKSPGISPPNFP